MKASDMMGRFPSQIKAMVQGVHLMPLIRPPNIANRTDRDLRA